MTKYPKRRRPNNQQQKRNRRASRFSNHDDFTFDFAESSKDLEKGRQPATISAPARSLSPSSASFCDPKKVAKSVCVQLLKREKIGSRLSVRRAAPRRSLCFSELRSNPSEAVIGLTPDGSGFLSLATSPGSDLLQLKVYGIPSPQVFIQQRYHNMHSMAQDPISPLLRVIPLMKEKDAVRTLRSDLREDPLTTVPVDLLLSTTSSLGVALLRHDSSSNQDLFPSFDDVEHDDRFGTLIAFDWKEKDGATAWEYRNARMGPTKQLLHNRLWDVSCCIPLEGDNGRRRQLQKQQTYGHLFLHDEQDGFLLTWFAKTPRQLHHLHRNSVGGTIKTTNAPPLLPNSKSPLRLRSSEDIVSLIEPTTAQRWIRTNADHEHLLFSPADSCSLLVVREAFLHMDVLVEQVHSRYVYGQKKPVMDYEYTLVDVDKAGRFARVAIVISAQGIRAWIATVDLWTSRSYEVREVKENVASFLLDGSSTADIERRIAIQCRMQSIGPFRIPKESSSSIHQHELDWSFLVDCWRNYSEMTGEDDHESLFDWTNSKIVKAILKGKRRRCSCKPNIPATKLYDCEVWTNEAVRQGWPVSTMDGRCVRLVYK